MVICIIPKGNKHKQMKLPLRDPRALAPTPPAQYASGKNTFKRYDPWKEPNNVTARKKQQQSPKVKQLSELDKAIAAHRAREAQKPAAPAAIAKPMATAKLASKPRAAARYYLAYGSNLNRRGMKQRCPDAEFCGPMMLQDAQLVFRSVADVTFMDGGKVPCGLWRISKRDEEALDRYEGYNAHNPAHGMYRKVEVTLNDGRIAMFYMMNSRGIYPPSKYYAETIREGYAHFGLDTRYLDDAIADSYARKEPDQQVVARRARLRRAGGKHAALASMTPAIAAPVLDADDEEEAVA